MKNPYQKSTVLILLLALFIQPLSVIAEEIIASQLQTEQKTDASIVLQNSDNEQTQSNNTDISNNNQSNVATEQKNSDILTKGPETSTEGKNEIKVKVL